MTHRERDPLLPSEQEARLAQETSRKLAAYVQADAGITMRLLKNSHETDTVALPAVAVRLLLDILEQMARGHTVHSCRSTPS